MYPPNSGTPANQDDEQRWHDEKNERQGQQHRKPRCFGLQGDHPFPAQIDRDDRSA